MKFFEYTEAERKEWRESDITRAYLQRLQEELQTAMGAILSCSRDTQDGSRAHVFYAGTHDGVEKAVNIANEVTK